MATDSAHGPAFEDLTARARIRDAALRHFAAHGVAGATIRGIARSAGVSPGLVRHHFGSKDALREACDAHVSEAFRRFNEQALTGGELGRPGFIAASQRSLQPFHRYLARALVDGSAAAASVFDEMVKMTEQWLVRSDAERADPPIADRRTRAALITAMGLGILVLHEHVSRAMGIDMFTAEGEPHISLALLDIHSHSLISTQLADSARAAYGEHVRDSAPERGAALRRQEEHHDD